MSKLATFTVLLVVILSITSKSIAQINALEERKEWARIYNGAKSSFQILDSLIQSELTTKERQVFGEIQTRIPRSPNIRPSASKIGQRRIISIPTGVTVFSEQMAYAFYMSAGNEESIPCWLSFLIATRELSENQQKRLSRNEHLQKGFNFMAFASSAPACKKSDLLSPYSVIREVNSTVEASLAFFYLHEAAHHILGHFENSNSEGTDLMQEIAADDWAVDQMLKVNVYPINAVAALIPYILYNPTTTSHPAFSRRLTNIYEKMAEWLRRSDKPWAGKLAAQEALAMADHFIRITRELDH